MLFKIKFYSYLFLVLILTGCIYNPTQPVPEIIIPSYYSYDNGLSNSGIYGVSEDGKGFLVSENLIKRYNLLIDKYAFIINIANSKDKLVYRNAGVVKLTDWLYFIDNQHFSYFLELNLFSKQQISNNYGEKKKK